MPPGNVFKRNLRATSRAAGHKKVRVVEVGTRKIDTYPEQAEVAMQPRQDQ